MDKKYIPTLMALGLWTPDHQQIYTCLTPFLGEEGIMQVIDPDQRWLDQQQAGNNFNKLKLLTTPLSNGKIPIYLLMEFLNTDEILFILKKDVFNEILYFLELFSHGSFYDFLKDKNRQEGFKEFVLAAIVRGIPNTVEFLKSIIYNLKLFNIEISPLDFRKIASEYDPAVNYNISNKKTFLDFLNSFSIRPVGVPKSTVTSTSLSANPATLSQSAHVSGTTGAYGMSGTYFQPSYGYPQSVYNPYGGEFSDPAGVYSSYNPAAYGQPNFLNPNYSGFVNPPANILLQQPGTAGAAGEEPDILRLLADDPLKDFMTAISQHIQHRPTGQIPEGASSDIEALLREDPFAEFDDEIASFNPTPANASVATLPNLEDQIFPELKELIDYKLYTLDHQRFYSRLNNLGIELLDIVDIVVTDRRVTYGGQKKANISPQLLARKNYNKLHWFFEPLGSSPYDRLTNSGYDIDLDALLKSDNWVHKLAYLYKLSSQLNNENFKLLFSENPGLGFTKKDIVEIITKANYSIDSLEDIFKDLADSTGNTQFLLSLNFTKSKLLNILNNAFARSHFNFICSLKEASGTHAPKTKLDILLELGFSQEQFLSLLDTKLSYKHAEALVNLLENPKIYNYFQSPYRRSAILDFLFNRNNIYKSTTKMEENLGMLLVKYGEKITDEEFAKILNLNVYYINIKNIDKVLKENRIKESYQDLRVFLSTLPAISVIPTSASSQLTGATGGFAPAAATGTSGSFEAAATPSGTTSSSASAAAATAETPLTFFGSRAKRARFEEAEHFSKKAAIENIIDTQIHLQSKLSNFLDISDAYDEETNDLISRQMELLQRISILVMYGNEFSTILKEYHSNLEQQISHPIWQVLTPDEQNIQKLEDLVKELETGPTLGGFSK